MTIGNLTYSAIEEASRMGKAHLRLLARMVALRIDAVYDGVEDHVPLARPSAGVGIPRPLPARDGDDSRFVSRDGYRAWFAEHRCEVGRDTR